MNARERAAFAGIETARRELVAEAALRGLARCRRVYRTPFCEMPIPVLFLWCSAVAANDEEMAAFEAEMERRS